MNVAAKFFFFFNQGASDYLQVELERDYCTVIICCIFLYSIVVCMFAYDSATINFSVLTERVFSHPTCISLYVKENSLKE